MEESLEKSGNNYTEDEDFDTQAEETDEEIKFP